MSNEAYNWARKQRVGSASAKSVLLDLAERANAAAQCWPMQETIAGDLELSIRNVTNAFTVLKELGLITTTRRYNGLQRLKGDLVTLHFDVEAAVEPSPKKPRGRSASATKASSKRDSAGIGVTPEQNANFAISPNVENLSGTQTLLSAEPEQNAKFAEQNAKFATHNKEQPSITPSDDDQSSNSTTNRGGDLSFVDERLVMIDPRLNEAGIRDRLSSEHGLTLDGVNVLAAAMVVWSRKLPTNVSNPIAFLAKSIASDPHNVEWADVAASTSSQNSDDCAAGNHRWTGQWNEICIRCDTLREGWRDDRDRDEAQGFPHEHTFETEDLHSRCMICDSPRSEIREPLEEGATR